MRDPYAVYASRILALRALDPLDADPGGAERGQIVHAVLEEFVRQWPDALPEDPATELLAHRRAPFPPARRAAAGSGHVVAALPARRRLVRRGRAQRRAVEAARVAAEIEGEIELPAPGGPFKLRARADRVEIGRDGRLDHRRLQDGPVPATTEVRLGWRPSS